MYNKINNINFTANMDTFSVKRDKKRWENIAKIYEEITPEYPNDTFDLAHHNSDNKYIIFSAANTNLTDNTPAMVRLCKHGYKDLMGYSDKEIAKKFKKIIELAHQNKDNYDKAQEFSKSVGLSGENKNALMKIMANHKNETKRDITRYDSFLNSIDLEV